MRNAKAVLVVALIALALLILVPILVMAGMMGGMGMMDGGMMNGGMMGEGMMGGMGTMLLGVLFLLLVLAGVALLVVWAVRRSDNGTSDSREDEALQILRARYARGEIGPEEFERMREELSR